MAIESVNYLGDIVMYGFNFAPRGYAYCAGQLVAISQNSALFSLLGVGFGGNGRTDFGLPDLRSRAPAGYYAGGTTYGLPQYTRGQRTGNEVSYMTHNSMPTHHHVAVFTPSPTEAVDATLTVKSGGANSGTPTTSTFVSGGTETIFGTGSGFGITNVEIPGIAVSAGSGGGVVTVGDTGNQTPFDHRNPAQAINFTICIDGLYPPRN